MELLPPQLQDAAVLRRLVFAAVHLPRDLPHYWSVVTQFASQGNQSGQRLEPESVKIAVENLKILSEKAFATDKQLISEVHALDTPFCSSPLGIVLVSPLTNCKLCGGKLLLRNDRASHVTVYTESYGTVVGTHYHKFCQHFRKGCSFRQYYGYSSDGTCSQPVTSYDSNWAEHEYFVSSSETAFELGMLMKFDAELLLGQISYNQKADIYNYCNGYPVHPKKCSTLEKEELPRFVWIQCDPLTRTHSGSFLLSYGVLVSGVNIMYQRAHGLKLVMVG